MTPTSETMDKKGSLVCVGTGMMLGAHLTPRARSSITQSEIVFVAVSDALVEAWIRQLHPDVRSLQPLYAPGKSRHQTYREMVAIMLEEVRCGRHVCGAFYGHPGVFATVPHAAIAQARTEGFPAHMEPGISAADCLFADLGIDPGQFGCQHYEASQLMFYRRRIDPTAYLILWQVGVAGDRSYQRFATGSAHRALLLELLLQHYPESHELIVYEAATLPIQEPRMQRIRLNELVKTEFHMHSTLVVPPARALEPDTAMLTRIAALEVSLGPRPAQHPELNAGD